MPRNNNKRAAGSPHDKAVEKAVMNRIRAMRITSPPSWYKSPGKYRDIPEIPNTPAFQLKQRVIGAATSQVPFTVSAADLSDHFVAAFNTLSINRIDVWGETNDGSIEVTCSFYVGSGTATHERTFIGTGTLGSKRPYVSAMISNAVTQIYNITRRDPIISCQYYNTTGEKVGTNMVADLYVTYTNTNSQLSGQSPTFITKPMDITGDALGPFQVV